MTAALLLAALAVLLVLSTRQSTGEGPAVGAIVGGLLLVGLAVAIWPSAWTNEEQIHRELDAIWREARRRRRGRAVGALPGVARCVREVVEL